MSATAGNAVGKNRFMPADSLNDEKVWGPLSSNPVSKILAVFRLVFL
ncbi:hypothetical protein ACVRXQ_07470 [Streptococcus panodentis]|nr:hypothetical protein [Streptococcus panodentis]